LYSNGRLDQHLQVLRRMLEERMWYMMQRLQERLADSLQFIVPAGGATVWVRSLRPVDLRQVFQRLLKQRIVVAPGELFSIHGLHSQSLRLSHTFNGPHDLDAALGYLADALRLELLE